MLATHSIILGATETEAMLGEEDPCSLFPLMAGLGVLVRALAMLACNGIALTL